MPNTWNWIANDVSNENLSATIRQTKLQKKKKNTKLNEFWFYRHSLSTIATVLWVWLQNFSTSNGKQRHDDFFRLVFFSFGSTENCIDFMICRPEKIETYLFYFSLLERNLLKENVWWHLETIFAASIKLICSVGRRAFNEILSDKIYNLKKESVHPFSWIYYYLMISPKHCNAYFGHLRNYEPHQIFF